MSDTLHAKAVDPPGHRAAPAPAGAERPDGVPAGLPGQARDPSRPSGRDAVRPRDAALAAGLVVLADLWLLGVPVGASLAAYLLALCLALWLARRATPRRGWIVGLAAVIPPLANAASPASVIVALMAVVGFAFACGGAPLTGGFGRGAARIARAIGFAPVDMAGGLGRLLARVRLLALARGLLAWAAPLGLGLVFLLLFASANPWISLGLDRLSAALDPSGWTFGLETGRMLYWAAVSLAIWPLLRAAQIAPPRSADLARSQPASARRAELDSLALRALLVGNLVFALQTLGDLATLWPRFLGAEGFLPEGVGHAAHAREGAFSLLAAAVLAGIVILVALRDGASGAERAATRALVLAWTVQTLVLLVSAASRLDLYVEAWGLTRLRLAAFVWMAVVAAGLVLTLARVLARRSNAWLTRASLAVGLAALYLHGAADTDGFIARHNAERAEKGRAVDTYYLCRLGPEALPALRRSGLVAPAFPPGRCVARLERQLAEAQGDWRSWTWRGHHIFTELGLDSPRTPLASPP